MKLHVDLFVPNYRNKPENAKNHGEVDKIFTTIISSNKFLQLFST